MEKKKIDRVIEAFRNYMILKENMMVANAPGTQGGGGSSADPKGPFPGYDNPLDGRSKIARRLPQPYRRDLIKKRKKSTP